MIDVKILVKVSYITKTTLTNLDIKHEMLRGLWHLYYIKKLLKLNINYPNHIQRRLNSWQYTHTNL